VAEAEPKATPIAQATEAPPAISAQEPPGSTARSHLARTPEPMQRPRILTWLEGVAHIAVILGVPLFFFQQFNMAQGLKRERSLAIIERFSDQDLLLARDAVQVPWREISVPELIAEGMDCETFGDLVIDVVRSDPRLQRSVFQIVDFFDTAHVCVEARVCDEETLTQFSQSYADEFYSVYRPYLDSLGRSLGAEAVARGLRSFVQRVPNC